MVKKEKTHKKVNVKSGYKLKTIKSIKLYKNDLLGSLKKIAEDEGFERVKSAIFLIDKKCINFYIKGFINGKMETRLFSLGKEEALFYLRFLKENTSLKVNNSYIYTNFKTVSLTVVFFKKDVLNFEHLEF
ncbi:MAG TPA: hypothetical protein PKD00_09020 [Burkholderiales bacterium]|nr:hypothetical protein [Burkholderiales bacterium]